MKDACTIWHLIIAKLYPYEQSGHLQSSSPRGLSYVMSGGKDGGGGNKKPTSSSLALVRCTAGPMMTSQSGKTSMSLLHTATGKVAVTNRYCVVTGEELIKPCREASKFSSLNSMSTSSSTALQK